MDPTFVHHAIAYLKDMWTVLALFIMAVISAVNPRWAWSPRRWTFADGAKPQPSGCWLWCTRLTSILLAALFFLILCYAKAAH